MKKIPGMNRRFLACSLLAIAFGSAALVSVARADNDAVVQTTDGVSYVSGGIGTESLERIGALARDFNLKLVFALSSGEYVSDVRVAIANAKGKTLLDTASEGPWFLTKLPAGNYQVVATFAGKAVKRQVAVGGTKLKTVDFRWAAE